MQSLNVEFTDDEHTQLRAAAEREGVSLRSYVHDAAVDRSSAHGQRVSDAARHSAEWSAELNRRLR
ncbi:MAG: antitoxin Phd [Gordonia sp.]|nr:antitoxin Phd [Gordonia sp. (in: high G+C Gram-positive bacteria)]